MVEKNCVNHIDFLVLTCLNWEGRRGGGAEERRGGGGGAG